MTPLVTAAHASARPVQRAGHIGTDDNRYCGAAVFGALAASATSQLDLTARAFGLRDLTDADREVLRVISLGLTSPDARVWPLKLTRVLAAYGNPYAGYFGAQLGTGSQQLGPGVTAGAAASLAWIRARVGDDPSDAAVAAAVAAHAAERGRIGGFGVPFRAEDERLIGMYKLLSHHPARRRPSWRLMEQVVHALREAHGVAPNIVIAIAALVLEQRPTTEPMFWGDQMEPGVASEAARRMGMTLERRWGHLVGPRSTSRVYPDQNHRYRETAESTLEPLVRSTLCRLLVRDGYVVVEATDGQHALELLSQMKRPDVVLLDLSMPRLDGAATFRELQKRDATLPVVLMSGYSEQDAVQHFLGEDLAGFVQKPFSNAEVLRCMSQALAKRAG